MIELNEVIVALLDESDIQPSTSEELQKELTEEAKQKVLNAEIVIYNGVVIKNRFGASFPIGCALRNPSRQN